MEPLEVDPDPNPKVHKLGLYRIIRATNGMLPGQLEAAHAGRAYRAIKYPGHSNLMSVICREEFARYPFYGVTGPIYEAVGDGYRMYNLDNSSLECLLEPLDD